MPFQEAQTPAFLNKPGLAIVCPTTVQGVSASPNLPCTTRCKKALDK